MFGGENNNVLLPGYLADHQFQFNSNALPQLQLFGDVGCSVGPSKFTGNQHATTVERPVKRSREVESISRQEKHHISLNDKVHQDEGGQHCSIMNPNPVSTGLRLSYEDDEHNSSVTSACENISGAIPHILSLGDNLKLEIDRQKEEFDQYMRIQEGNMIKGVREMKQRHTYSFLSAIEKEVGRRLHGKEMEIEVMNCKNKELVEKIKQVSMEVQSWHYKAKYNESVVNALKNNLKQAMAQGSLHVKEGCGDSEVDDAASHTNLNYLSVVDGSGNSSSMKMQMICRACNIQEVSILLLPCRHLCLCKDCEGLIGVCPVCKAMRTASVEVYLS